MDIKELYFENAVRKHQLFVLERMTACTKYILDRAIKHDSSKLVGEERKYYIDPTFELSDPDIKYRSKKYKQLINQIGEGLQIHFSSNDHHPEFFRTNNDDKEVLKKTNLFILMEMLCDWIAAAKRMNNKPELAFISFQKKFNVSSELLGILINTLKIIEEL